MASVKLPLTFDNEAPLYFDTDEEEKNKISLLSREIFLYILSHLKFCELGNAALVCKNWQHIIIENLVNIDDLLNEYNFSLYNASNFDEAVFHLVADRHPSRTCQWLIGALIGLLASKHRVIVLVEYTSSMEELETDQGLMRQYHIPLKVMENIIFIGCDAKNLQNEVGLIISEYKSLLIDEDIFSKQIEKIANATLAICPNVEHLSKLKESERMRLRLLGELSIEAKKCREPIHRELRRGLLTEEQFRGTFPRRTAAMCTTLKTVQKMICDGTFEGKVVMHVGAQHIRTKEKNRNIKEFQLDELYETLSHLSAAVMIPKRIDNGNFKERNCH